MLHSTLFPVRPPVSHVVGAVGVLGSIQWQYHERDFVLVVATSKFATHDTIERGH